MTSMKFIWIDDDPKRKANIKGINGHKYQDFSSGKTIKGEGEFLGVKGLDAINEVSKKENKWNFDLVIIDHFLNQSIGPARKGPTVAALIRDLRPMVPIIGVTADDLLKKVDRQTINNYEDLFIVENVGECFDIIYSVAVAFKKYSKERAWNSEKIFNLLKAPKEDHKALKEILPDYKDTTGPFLRDLYQWTRKSLIANPGFLFDRPWISTLLGLKESSFYKVEKLFKIAEYKGIFFTPGERRWWKGTVKDILFKTVQTKEALLPWQAGRHLPKIKGSDFSICACCGKFFPETMGFSDERLKRIVPLHYSCSIVLGGKSKQLYFEQTRRMKD